MKFRVVEWYVDAFGPGDANDHVVRWEDIETATADEAKRVYEMRNNVSENNELRVDGR